MPSEIRSRCEPGAARGPFLARCARGGSTEKKRVADSRARGYPHGIGRIKIESSRDRNVFLFDVDNTLLDNDRVTRDIRKRLEQEVGKRRAAEYWKIFENLRAQLGYADYLGALQRYRLDHAHDWHLLGLSRFLIDYPFRKRLYPGALKAIRHARKWGKAGLLSDGDVVFQPKKIESSGLFKAMEGNVLITIHKEHELRGVEKRFPAKHYVLVDDKIRILDAVKRIWGTRVTTVFVRQGHYALDKKVVASYPSADVTIDRIGDLLNCDLGKWCAS